MLDKDKMIEEVAQALYPHGNEISWDDLLQYENDDGAAYETLKYWRDKANAAIKAMCAGLPDIKITSNTPYTLNMSEQIYQELLSWGKDEV